MKLEGWTMSKGVYVGVGENCRHCKKPMARMKRKAPPPLDSKQKYWFSHWDVCGACNRVHHYDEFKRPNREQWPSWQSKGVSGPCPKCNEPTERRARERPPEWFKGIWYAAWDHCAHCRYQVFPPAFEPHA